jgi:uncharacterized protein (TIGR02996 family)
VALDPLHAKVLAEPEDDALRSVWADALIERGDPLGELISIQALAAHGKLTPAQDKRARSLIAKHRVAWLAELADVVQHREGLVLDRGVLTECQIQVKRLPALARAVGHPLWAALTRIWFCDRFAWDPRIVPLLVHPVLARLREVYTIGLHNVFTELARREPPLPFTTIWTVDDTFRDPHRDARELAELPGLPALRTLGFTYHTEQYVLELPIVRRIETLGMVNSEPAALWLRRTVPLDNLRSLELRRWWIPIQGPQRPHYILTFTRGPSGQWSTLAVGSAGRVNADMLTENLSSVHSSALLKITAPAELHPLLRRFKRAELVAPAE